MRPGPPHSFSLLSPSHGVALTVHSAFGRASALAAGLLRSESAPQKQCVPLSTPATLSEPAVLCAPWHASAQAWSDSVPSTAASNVGSTGPALLVGDWAMAQLWLFWLAPLIGAAVAGLVYRWFEAKE